MKETSVVDIGVASSSSHSTTLHFQISDTGQGIDEQQLKLIFEPFEQADNSNTRKHGGTGLGLAVCSGILETAGGRIWVESAVNIGTTFHFEWTFRKTLNRSTRQPLRKRYPHMIMLW